MIIIEFYFLLHFKVTLNIEKLCFIISRDVKFKNLRRYIDTYWQHLFLTVSHGCIHVTYRLYILTSPYTCQIMPPLFTSVSIYMVKKEEHYANNGKNRPYFIFSLVDQITYDNLFDINFFRIKFISF